MDNQLVNSTMFLPINDEYIVFKDEFSHLFCDGDCSRLNTRTTTLQGSCIRVRSECFNTFSDRFSGVINYDFEEIVIETQEEGIYAVISEDSPGYELVQGVKPFGISTPFEPTLVHKIIGSGFGIGIPEAIKIKPLLDYSTKDLQQNCSLGIATTDKVYKFDLNSELKIETTIVDNQLEFFYFTDVYESGFNINDLFKPNREGGTLNGFDYEFTSSSEQTVTLTNTNVSGEIIQRLIEKTCRSSELYYGCLDFSCIYPFTVAYQI